VEDQGFLEEERFGEEISRAVGEKEPRERSPLRRVLGGPARAPPGAIEAREIFRQRIKGTGAREKTLFPNEASNYQLGGQFAVVAGFVVDRAREKDWAATCPRNGSPKHWCRKCGIG